MRFLWIFVLLLTNFVPSLAQDDSARCAEADWHITWDDERVVTISDELPYQPEPENQPPIDTVDDLILFGLNINNQPQLYAIDTTGEYLYCIAVCPTGCRAPVWSGDGERIGFVTGEGVTVMPLDGREQTDIPLNLGTYVHQNDSGQRLFDWTGDLSRVVFTARVDNNNSLFIVDTTTGELIHINYAPRGAFLPRFSPDEDHIIFAAGEQLYILTPSIPDIRVLSSDQTRFDSVDWSPDGELITFREIFMGTLRVMTMDINTGDITLLHEGVFDVPLWSPDGQKIVVNLWQNSSGSEVALAVLSFDGEIIIIAENAKSVYTPAWTADSTQVVYVGVWEDDPMHDGLYIADATGQNPPQLLIAPISSPTDIATVPATYP